MKPSYEELEARCAALAAEVQSVKDGAAKAIDDIQCFHNTDGWHVSEDGESETAVVSLDDAKGSVEHFVLKVETPSTDAFLAEVLPSSMPDEAAERDLFEEWVMEKILISKSTLEGLRTDDGYRNSTLSGTDYNGMWSQWKSIRAAQLRQEAK